MFSHFSRFNLFLIFLAIIALRLVVGFHFYKEGVTKLQDGFDAQYFLKGAKGPFADFFLSMTDDANGRMQLGITETLDDKGKTDFLINNERTIAVWDDFVEQATNYYAFGSPELIAEIQAEIKDYEKLAAGEDDSASRARSQIQELEAQIDEIEEQPWQVAEALEAHEAELEDWTMANRVAVLAWYRGGTRLEGFERDGEDRDKVALDVASLRGQVDSIQKDRVKEMTKWKTEVAQIWDSLETRINSIPVARQERETGSLPLHRPYAQKNSRHDLVNKVIPWFDITVGVLLILGLFTRWASLAAAAFLFSVLLTQPFWVPGAAPTHYQAIEMFACLVLFATSAGRFGGLDYFFSLGKRPADTPEPAMLGH
ncbi:TQO small subunit DoxD [Mariniblastus fucicola]|uniref:DoxX n=1 Tax=Mariniblastus fucicola TaxID=980251 RepID=A0A5B9PKD9_9BACT|nr:TQO small subunit DoxD [Mariniblastus fucicola]QEG23131.1 DoxX [Mariniblastus fucicola]